MQRTGFQKALLVVSVLSIIGAVLNILGGLGLMGGGALLGGSAASAELEAAAAEAGTTTTGIAATFIGGGLGVVAAGILSGIEGVLGIRAANDATKIKPVWIIAVIGLVLAVLGLVLTFGMGLNTPENIGSAVGSIIGNGLMFWIANSIKVQAGV